MSTSAQKVPLQDIPFSGSLTLDQWSTNKNSFNQFSFHTQYQSPPFLSQTKYFFHLPIQANTVVIITSNTLEINHSYNFIHSKAI